MEKDDKRRTDLRDFLRLKREKILPADVGLPPGARRRTPGLRREEVAQLANISPTWYTWLEQGREIKPSEEVLDSIARALQLSSDERLHLFRLAAPYTAPPGFDGPVRDSYRRVLEKQKANPAYIMNWRWDTVAWNPAACAVFVDFNQLSLRERNIVYLMFTNPEVRKLIEHWEVHAKRVISQFYADFGEYNSDPAFIELITLLKNTSEEFRAWWGLEVGSKAETLKVVNHRTVGRLELEQTSYRLEDVRGWRLVLYMPANDCTDNKLQNLYDAIVIEQNKSSAESPHVNGRKSSLVR